MLDRTEMTVAYMPQSTVRASWPVDCATISPTHARSAAFGLDTTSFENVFENTGANKRTGGPGGTS